MVRKAKNATPLILFCLSFAILLPRAAEDFLLDQSVQRLLMARLDIGRIVFSCPDSRNPFLYMLLLKAIAWAAGNNEFAARIPGMLFTSATCTLVFMILRRRTSWILAVSGSLLILLSPQLVEQGREITTVALFVFWALLSTHFFHILVSSDRDRGVTRFHAAGYLASTFLMACSNYFFVFVLAAQIVFVLICSLRNHGRNVRHVLKPLAAAALLCVPSAVLAFKGLIGDLPTRRAASISPLLSWGALDYSSYLREIGNYFITPSSMNNVSLVNLFVMLVLFLLLFMVFKKSLFKHDLSIFSAILIVMTMATNVLLVPYMRLQPYYIAFLIPYFWITWVLGAEALCTATIRTGIWRNAILGGIIACSLAYQLSMFQDRAPWIYFDSGKSTIAPMAAMIQACADKPVDLVFEHYRYGWFFLYYSNTEMVRAEDVFTNKNPHMDQNGISHFQSPAMRFTSLRPWKNAGSEALVRQLEFNNFKNLNLKRFWFLISKDDYVDQVRNEVRSRCTMKLANDSFELYRCVRP